jgi:hypothetical protein
LARMHLAESYALIWSLIYDESASDEHLLTIAAALDKTTNDLARLEYRVGFIEELIATAMVAESTRSETHAGRMWAYCRHEGLAHIEHALAAECEVFPLFSAEYPRVERAVRYIRTEAAAPSTIRSWLIPTLQAVERTAQGEYEPKGQEHFDAVLQIFDEEPDPAQVIKALEPVFRDVVRDWLALLSESPSLVAGWEEDALTTEDYPNMAAQALFSGRDMYTTQGEDRNRSAVRRVSGTVERLRAGSASPGFFVLLHPEPGRRRLRRRTFSPHGEIPPDDIFAMGLTVITTEAIRQQFLARRGFMCPWGPGRARHCQCGRAARASYRRLASLARSGLSEAACGRRPRSAGSGLIR